MGIFTPPFELQDRIKRLGSRVRLARTRRGWSITDLAARANVDRNTIGKLELGSPGISMGTYLLVLWLLDLDHTLDAVADPDKDIHGKTLERSRGPRRVRKTNPTDEYDF